MLKGRPFGGSAAMWNTVATAVSIDSNGIFVAITVELGNTKLLVISDQRVHALKRGHIFERECF